MPRAFHQGRKLVLAGAPIDIAAGNSKLSDLARNTPMAIFKSWSTSGRPDSGSTVSDSFGL
jgi:hypothetical protein